MKLAILSDIHGNLAALEAVLRHARGQGAVQTILNLGDSIGYGPEPEAVIGCIQGEYFTNIRGDYDGKVLDKKYRKAGWSQVKNPDKREMFAWTFRSLSRKSRRYLKSLPQQRSLEIEGVKILMTHAGPGPEDAYLGPDTPDSLLQELAVESNADVILSGHSHHAFTRQVNGRLFINPGSVGRPDDGDPRAAYAILEIHGDDLSVRLFRVPYNLMASVHALQKSGLPEIFTQVLQQGMNYNDVANHLGTPPQFDRLEPNGTLTLLTDFGLSDHFIGVMKGVILDIAPQTRLVDISHQIHPQNVMQGARMLAETIPYFTPGTVHLAVVDPGVGTQRRAMAARIGSQFFVAPDNGLLSFVLRDAHAKSEEIKIVSLTQEQYWLPEPGNSFHGRDIFAPVGAHLVNGLPLEKLGETMDDPVLLIQPLPEKTPTGWLGEVVMSDTFGNLSTNLSREIFPKAVKHITVEVAGESIPGLTPTFGDAPPGSLIATIDSSGALAISVVNGSAKEDLNADIGTPVNVRIEI